jgi:hypothetical protein
VVEVCRRLEVIRRFLDVSFRAERIGDDAYEIDVVV